MDKFDIIIIGGGPAGLTAALYSLRAGLKTLLIEKQNVGGQTLTTDDIKNYPGFLNISGAELSQKMHDQIALLGVNIIYDDVKSYNLNGDLKQIETYASGTFTAQTIIIATGVIARNLGIENEKKLIGAGISYCAVCDGAFFKGATVAVVGGGNSALEDALYLSGFAEKVYLIHRRDEYRAENELVNEINNNKKIIKIMDSKVIELVAQNKLQGIKIQNVKTEEIKTINVNGLFIAVGRGPDTEFIKNAVKLDENGYIIANEKMETSVAGVYAAGDVRNTNLRQIVTACSDGAIAATMANKYIKTRKYQKSN